MRPRPLIAALTILAISVVTALAQPPGRPSAPPRAAPQAEPRAPVAWIDAHVHLVAGRGTQADYPGAVEAEIGRAHV